LVKEDHRNLEIRPERETREGKQCGGSTVAGVSEEKRESEGYIAKDI